MNPKNEILAEINLTQKEKVKICIGREMYCKGRWVVGEIGVGEEVVREVVMRADEEGKRELIEIRS